MIEVRAAQVERPLNTQGISITLRNGFTYVMLVVTRPAGSFISYEGFEKFLREQTIRSGAWATIKLTMLVEKEQVMLVPQLAAHICDNQNSLPPVDQQQYYSVSLYKTDIKKHPSPSEASKVTMPALQYGMDLFDPYTHSKVGYISNIVCFHEYRYYLCEMEEEAATTVVANSQGFPVGLVVRYGNVKICLSCRDLLDSNRDNSSQPILTDELTRSWLMRTCYIECEGRYGTGVLEDGGKIMTAKHIVPQDSREIGGSVRISLYPYSKIITAKISAIDAVKDYLEVALSPEDIPPIKQLPHDHSLELGTDITAIGFGKYNFCLSNFTSGLMLPTLQKGIVSKVVRHAGHSIFIKTDAHLSNGFSGCGVWSGKGLLGMAVFIVVNGQKKLLWHNYSYTCEFLESKAQQHQEYLAGFDQIYLRSQLPLYPKL